MLNNDIPTQHPELSQWIGAGKQYRNVPDFVSEELGRRLVVPADEMTTLPSKTLSISELLDANFSLQTQSLQVVRAESCFADNKPNATLRSLIRRPFPSRKFIRELRSASGQAMLNGKQSIRDWTRKDIYLPFCVLTWWEYMSDAAAAKLSWHRANDWLTKLKFKDKAVVTRVFAILEKIPWHGSLHGSKSFVSVTDMASFLSREMLTTSQVCAMLLRLEARIKTLAEPHHNDLIIASPTFADGLAGIPSYPSPYPIGATSTLQDISSEIENSPKKIWTVAYSKPFHFGALLIDNMRASQLNVNWGDSLGRKMPSTLVKGIKIWAAHHFPNKRLVFEENLACALQGDTYSCAIISVNTLKHHILGDSIWSIGTRELSRIEEFLQIMEHALQVSSSLPISADVDIEMGSGIQSTNKVKRLVDNVLDIPAIPQKRKFSELDDDSDSSDDDQLQSKHQNTTSTDKQPKDRGAKKPFLTGLSRSGAAKRAILEAVNNGTFVISDTKWEKFKTKLTGLDPMFTVDKKNVLVVRHLRCVTDLTMGQPYEVNRYKLHLQTCKGKKSREAASNTRPLDTIFQPSNKSHQSKAFKLWPCPGLTAENSDPRIANYLARTAVESAGGISHHTIARELYNVKTITKLTQAQRNVVDIKQKQTHRWRLDLIHSCIFAIGETPCKGDISIPDNNTDPDLTVLKPCKSCQDILSLRQFKTAINKDIPDEKNLIHVPRCFINSAVGEMMLKNRGLSDLLKETSGSTEATDIFYRFARKFAEGKFDDQPIFLGLLQTMVDQQDRKDRGRGLQNIKYAPAFDEWCHELQCIRPEAYRTFQQTFGGRTERNFLKLRSTAPSFHQGISEHTVQRAEQYRKDYGYPKEAPLVSGVDDTKLLEDFRPYFDGKEQKWYVLGGIGEPMEVADINLLQAQLAEANASKASKLRLWTLGIPLPRVPPLILAACPIGSKNSAKNLAMMESRILNLLISSPANFNIISLGSDGTTVEREARRELERIGFATNITRQIPHPEGGEPIIIKLLKVQNRVMVPIQDTKHTRKTLRNNLFAGPRSLILGRYVICYQHVREIAFDKARSPLYERDVVKLDRQDDRAAARLFSGSTLEYLVKTNSENLGLTVFLFVFGELVDAYQSRTISHQERVKQAFRAQFFKDLWKTFLKDADYPLARHFLSHEADDIIDIVVNGLLGLIYIHRDYLEGRFPLLPWMSGTESNEHVFGFLRTIVPDFTMLDVLRLVPKLAVKLMAACKRKGKAANFKKTASGYSHTYSEADDADLNFLASFPTNEEITLLVKTAYDEAVTLWGLLGYYPSGEACKSSVNINEDDLSEGEEEEPTEVSDRQELQDALDMASAVQYEGLPSDKVDTALDECGFAAASLNFNDLEKMYVANVNCEQKLNEEKNSENLPDSSPEALEELRLALSKVLQAISAQGPVESTMVQNLLTSVVSSACPEGAESATSVVLDTLSSVTETDLSQLVVMRLANQSRECRESVRNPRAEAVATEGEWTNTKMKGPSERQLLAKKVHEILKANAEGGTSTGLNRRVRWEKFAAGSVPGTNEIATGNTANAQAAARTGASAIITKRRKAFGNTELYEDLSTAKIDQLSKLTAGCYGIAMVDDRLMIVKVLTIYERGGGKTAKHGWVSESSSIGAVSYLPVQAWCQNRQRNFKALWGATSSMQLPRFAHLHASAFLYYIPEKLINYLSNGLYIDLALNFYNEVFIKLEHEKVPIVTAVKFLTAVKRKKKNDDDEGL